jgi:uncharacterized protein (DUF2336 family)
MTLPSTPYDQHKKMAADTDEAVRLALAKRADVEPEILYYLASDEKIPVRLAIAENDATPLQAAPLLARDCDENVRAALAVRITKLAPDLSLDEAGHIRDLALEALEILAKDQIPRIRVILADALKQSEKIPAAIMRQLAFDAEAMVANPVLEFSPLLSDEDLLAIIQEGGSQGRLTAIARRHDVSEKVTEAVVASFDEPAIAALLTNASAQIREETLDAITDQAEHMISLHEPLATRAHLPLSIIERMARFIHETIMEKLFEKQTLGEDLKEKLRAIVQEQLNKKDGKNKTIPTGLAAGDMGDEEIADAIDRQDFGCVTEALAARAELPLAAVQKIIQSKSAKATVALSHRANYSMRTAVRLQVRLCMIPAASMISAKNGEEYPLTAEAMSEYLDLFLG